MIAIDLGAHYCPDFWRGCVYRPHMRLDASTQQLALVIVGIVCRIACSTVGRRAPWPAGRVP